VTSHALLERFGIIHEVHADHHRDDGESHEHNAYNNDFADGGYISKTTGNSAPIRANLCLYQAAWLTVVLHSIDLDVMTAFGPAPPGLAPPEFLHSLNFLLRTSADVRAPSSLA
jgi:hypothetical protein